MIEDEVNGNVIPNLPSHNVLTMQSSSTSTGTPPRNSGSTNESFSSPEVKKKPPDYESMLSLCKLSDFQSFDGGPCNCMK